jgi:hypothetical protein
MQVTVSGPRRKFISIFLHSLDFFAARRLARSGVCSMTHRASDYAPIGDYATSSPRQRPGSQSLFYRNREGSPRKDRRQSPIVAMMASCLIATALLASVFDEPMNLRDELRVRLLIHHCNGSRSTRCVKVLLLAAVHKHDVACHQAVHLHMLP